MMPPYTLVKSSRARMLRISVSADGEVRVTVPQRANAREIDQFLARSSAWIARHVASAAARPVVRAEKRLIPRYKRMALTLARERARYYAARYGVAHKQITIRAQKSRWGSCSRTGNLSFNYKIALLPPRFVEYIVVHEICHLVHFDHSRAFWASVAQEIPEHRELRKALRLLAFRFL